MLQSDPSSGSGGKQFLENTFTDSTLMQSEKGASREGRELLVQGLPSLMRNLKLEQRFSTGGEPVPREHLATSADIFGCHLARGGGMLQSSISRGHGCC